MRLADALEVASELRDQALTCGDERGADALDYFLTLVEQQRGKESAEESEARRIFGVTSVPPPRPGGTEYVEKGK